MSLVDAIALAAAGNEVPAATLERAFDEIARGEASPVRIAALLVALRTKGETVSEIAAAVRALRAHAETTALVDPRTVDTCGTGGDGRNTFNISTIAAFVVAGAGVPVAKHGNRAASGRAGSFDLLEALGVAVYLPVAAGAQLLAEVGIGPFFARRAHPAMRHVAPVRAELPVRTLMNCLGPLLNPVGTRRQLVGVYAAELVAPLAQVLAMLGSECALVVHGSDGLDELTTTGPSEAAWLEGGAVTPLCVDPESFGIPRARSEDLAGGDVAENAANPAAGLPGAAGPRPDIVQQKAGAARWVAGAGADHAAGIELARKSLVSGAASAKLAALVAASRRLAAAA
jgi:anthranilate phosphoribosyltransferase